MSNLETAKRIVKENFKGAECGIFNTRNIAGDEMTTIYAKDGLTVDICYGYSYFEVFGLPENEYEELFDYYHELRGW